MVLKTFHESAELLDYGFDKFRHEEVDAALNTTTLGQLAGICHFGTASVLIRKKPVSGRSKEKYRKRYDPEKTENGQAEARFL